MKEDDKRNRWRYYPDDGGLKEPVREFGEGPNVFDMIRKHFTK